MAIRDIKFDNAECLILSVEHAPRILVKWSIKKSTQNLNSLFFFIYRGESPSDMVRLNSTPIPSNTLYEYVDATPKLKIVSKNYYFKVIAEEIVAGLTVQSFESHTFTWQGSVDLVAQYIIDEHLYAYEHVHGVPAFLYKKKREGDRCEVCWDKVTKRVSRSNCTNCFGTGFAGGYYKSITTWMDFNPDPMIAQIAEFGLKEPSQTDIQFTNYPLLQLGDIILELEPFRFWRLSNIRNTEKNRTPLLQVARVDEVNKSDIEQNLPVDQEIRQQLLKQLDDRQRKAEF